MRPHNALRALLALTWLVASCSSSVIDQPDDAGASLDGGSLDAGADDAGALFDAGSDDAGVDPDAGESSDGGAPVGDAGSADGGAPDAGAPGDAGTSADAGAAAFDPRLPGPCSLAEFDVTITAAATGDALPLHAVYPESDCVPPPWPTVIIAHGFILPASQYEVTAQTLAAYGAIAVTVDYPTSLLGSPDYVDSVADLSAALDWIDAQGAQAADANPLAGKVSAQAVMLGHSLGGKLAILEAAGDARVAAVIGFDPVDATPDCAAGDCPTAASVMPLSIPTLFLGETIDEATTLGQACAPADANFETLYALANSPSVQVDIEGADHMSFLDDPASCGLTCLACKPATADHDEVIALIRAEANAFIERYLRGNAAASSWIAGAQAQSTWVSTGQAAIESQ